MSHILVIDDDEAIRATLTIALEVEGYTVQSAANGELALQALQSEPLPQMIFLDLMMPVMDGWQFMKKKAEDSRLKPIPVVIISAFSERAVNLACQDILKKPVDLPRLFELAKQNCA